MPTTILQPHHTKIPRSAPAQEISVSLLCVKLMAFLFLLNQKQSAWAIGGGGPHGI